MAGTDRRMQPERPATPEPADGGATSASADATGREPVEPGPGHDPTTSREAFEREMAEQGRTDEAARHGDHIE